MVEMFLKVAKKEIRKKKDSKVESKKSLEGKKKKEEVKEEGEQVQVSKLQNVFVRKKRNFGIS
jgi:hypothetical protein